MIKLLKENLYKKFKIFYIYHLLFTSMLLIYSSMFSNDTVQKNIIDLGIPDVDLEAKIGLNYQLNKKDIGLIGLVHYKRVTNFTYYDMQLNAFFNPKSLKRFKENTYYLLWRFKGSNRSFDWDWFYSWSIYQLKTSTIEELNARAIIESGYGFFLYNLKSPSKDARLNLELGLVFDYSNLENYTSNIASGYFKVAIAFDIDFKFFSNKFLFYEYYQIFDPLSSELSPDQTRLDMEYNGIYHMHDNIDITIGAIYTQYQMITEIFTQPDFALTVFTAISLKY